MTLSDPAMDHQTYAEDLASLVEVEGVLEATRSEGLVAATSFSGHSCYEIERSVMIVRVMERGAVQYIANQGREIGGVTTTRLTSLLA